MSYAGPLPTPEMLRQCEDILPGSAEKIMRLAEGNNIRRHERLEAGQYGSIVIAALAILGACGVIALSNSWPAVFFGVPVIAIGVGGSTVAMAFVERFPKKVDEIRARMW